jgi:hypothetical protein
MTQTAPYLEVTYRHGKALAAYLYLARKSGDTAARTVRHGSWLVDYTDDGRAIGIEFPSVGTIDLAELNRLLAAAQHPTLSPTDIVPLVAA